MQVSRCAAVPRFHFHLHEYCDCLDEEGQEMPDLDTAREKAKESAREFACEGLKRGHLNLDHWIEIADGEGNVLETVTFRDAFTVTG